MSSDDQNGDLASRGPAAVPIDLPCDIPTSRWFREQLIANANDSLCQYYRLPDFHPPSKVSAFCASELETHLDSRFLQLGVVTAPPSTSTARLNDIWAMVSTQPSCSPVETESRLQTLNESILYASDFALADFEGAGSRHATLLDVAMPALTDEYELQVKLDSILEAVCVQNHWDKTVNANDAGFCQAL